MAGRRVRQCRWWATGGLWEHSMTNPSLAPTTHRRPRGRRLFEPFKPGLKDFVRALVFIPVFLSGALAADMTQTAAQNYHLLFRQALVLTVIHLVLSALYIRYVPGRLRWLGLLISLLALVCLTELSLRVFFGVRLFG